jgi:hypothetical protein
MKSTLPSLLFFYIRILHSTRASYIFISLLYYLALHILNMEYSGRIKRFQFSNFSQIKLLLHLDFISDASGIH